MNFGYFIEGVDNSIYKELKSKRPQLPYYYDLFKIH